MPYEITNLTCVHGCAFKIVYGKILSTKNSVFQELLCLAWSMFFRAFIHREYTVLMVQGFLL